MPPQRLERQRCHPLAKSSGPGAAGVDHAIRAHSADVGVNALDASALGEQRVHPAPRVDGEAGPPRARQVEAEQRMNVCDAIVSAPQRDLEFEGVEEWELRARLSGREQSDREAVFAHGVVLRDDGCGTVRPRQRQPADWTNERALRTLEAANARE